MGENPLGLLWDLLIADLHIVHGGLAQAGAAAEPGGTKELGVRAVKPSIMPLVWGCRASMDGAMFDCLLIWIPCGVHFVHGASVRPNADSRVQDPRLPRPAGLESTP